MATESVWSLCICQSASAAHGGALGSGMPFERFYIFEKRDKGKLPRLFASAFVWSLGQSVPIVSSLITTVAERISNTIRSRHAGTYKELVAEINKNPNKYLLVVPTQFFKVQHNDEVRWYPSYIMVRPTRTTTGMWLRKAQLIYRNKWESACARCPALWEKLTSQNACNRSARGCRQRLFRPVGPIERSSDGGIRQDKNTTNNVSTS